MSAGTEIDLYFVGCGGIARRYHLPALEQDSAVRIRGIADPMPAPQTVEMAARHGAVVVDDIAQLPRGSTLAVAICSSPHALHAEHARASLNAGFHTLVDKPFVLRAEEAVALWQLAEQKQLVNAVAFNRRFDAACLRARAIIANGGIGDVRFVQTVQLGYERAGWFLVPEIGGGGPFTGRGAHMADLIPGLLGRKPTRLRSRVRGASAARSDAGGFIELQFDDLECQMACIEEGLHMWDEVRIFGETGFLEMRRPLGYPIGWTLEYSSERGSRTEQLDANSEPGHATRDFLAAVRGAGQVACTFAEATLSVEIIEQAFASARLDGAWRRLGAADAKAPLR